MINFEEDILPITDDQVQNISSLAAYLVQQQEAVEQAEEELKEMKKQLRKTAELDLPEALATAGVDMMRLSNGKTVTVSETLYASIPKKNKHAAAKWLMDNELGSLVKEDVTVLFEKGQEDLVLELTDMLREQGYDQFTVNETINTASIKSAIKELMAEGKDVPLDLFGAHFVKKAEVK